MYRDKIQNIIKNLRNEEEDDILFWDYKDIPETNLENYLNQEEPNDDDIRETE